MTIIVGQPIKGGWINPLEWLLMPNSPHIAEFEDEGQAKQYLRDQGYEDDEIEDCFVYQETGSND